MPLAQNECRKLVESLQSFDGSTNIELFINEINLILPHVAQADHPILLTLLKLKLEGPAAEYIANKDCTTIQSFQTMLREYFFESIRLSNRSNIPFPSDTNHDRLRALETNESSAHLQFCNTLYNAFYPSGDNHLTSTKPHLLVDLPKENRNPKWKWKPFNDNVVHLLKLNGISETTLCHFAELTEQLQIEPYQIFSHVITNIPNNRKAQNNSFSSRRSSPPAKRNTSK
jgi:hypothetical protein